MATRTRTQNENENEKKANEEEKKNAKSEKPTGINSVNARRNRLQRAVKEIIVLNGEARAYSSVRRVARLQATLDTEIAKTFSDSVSATILRLPFTAHSHSQMPRTADCDSVGFLSSSQAENIPFGAHPPLETIVNFSFACQDEWNTVCRSTARSQMLDARCSMLSHPGECDGE